MLRIAIFAFMLKNRFKIIYICAGNYFYKFKQFLLNPTMLMFDISWQILYKIIIMLNGFNKKYRGQEC